MKGKSFLEKIRSSLGKINTWRFFILFSAFVVIIGNPFVNYKWDINFIQGWFQSFGIGNLWIVSPLEGLETILTAKFLYTATIVGMVVPVLLAFLLGRVFCSWLCPIEFLSNLTDRVLGFLSKKLRYRKDLITLPRRIIWFVLITELLITLIIGYPMFVWWSPPGLVGREAMFYAFYKVITIEIVIVVAVLFFNLLTRRFFCRYFCPLGATLALIGKKRQLVIKYDKDKCINCKACDTKCPMGIKPSIGESQSVYCWNCAECVDTCPTKALSFTWNDDGIIKLKVHNSLTSMKNTDKLITTK
ncbi:MAG: 4Fe-4S binding protein [Desulfurobacteriaceae bacterium]